MWWRKKKPAATLQQGAEKLDAVLRGLGESQRAFKASAPGRGRVFSPSEEWSRKYHSQGIGGDSAYAKPIACFEDGTCLPPRNQLMRELSARAAGRAVTARSAPTDVTNFADIGKAPMHKPFEPEKPKRKRSWLFG